MGCTTRGQCWATYGGTASWYIKCEPTEHGAVGLDGFCSPQLEPGCPLTRPEVSRLPCYQIVQSWMHPDCSLVPAHHSGPLKWFQVQILFSLPTPGLPHTRWLLSAHLHPRGSVLNYSFSHRAKPENFPQHLTSESWLNTCGSVTGRILPGLLCARLSCPPFPAHIRPNEGLVSLTQVQFSWVSRFTMS